MKIKYIFANDEKSEVEVSEEIGNVVINSKRIEDNLDRKERSHCYSMNAADFEGDDYADYTTPEILMEQKISNRHIAEALDKLSEVQKRRLLMYTNGMTYQKIADVEGVKVASVYESIEAAIKKFKKVF
ncbi:MAG: sigma factor-like helix-turn-helix DNA-binding protein [Candidatus Metalachnospira sp.]|nr:sigma factor-like helix-turn-helix DNA-binding protein [Candidatus Metalachnospira sp.]